MSRQQSNTADYFKHIAKPGKTVAILEAKFGNDGYAGLFKVLEVLTSSDNHFYDCTDKKQWNYLVGRFLVDERKAKAIISLLAEIGILDLDLWKSGKILWSDPLMETLKQVYQKRHRPVPEKPPLVTENPPYARHSVTETGAMPPVEDKESTQRKVKESRAEQRKEQQQQQEELQQSVPEKNLGGAVPAGKGQDLEQILYDRIGWKRRLSRLDWDKLLELKREYGDEAFFRACNELHGEVKNVPTYLRAILKAKQETEKKKSRGPLLIQCDVHREQQYAIDQKCPRCTEELNRVDAKEAVRNLKSLGDRMDMNSTQGIPDKYHCPDCNERHSPNYVCSKKAEHAAERAANG